jgi:acetylornithine deacetylase/succinyl-diaminopimelate desuccinylase-like protein
VNQVHVIRHKVLVTGKVPKSSCGRGSRRICFDAERGMPAYGYGPALLSISHGPKEFVDTNRIVECAAIYARVAAKVLQRNVSA